MILISQTEQGLAAFMSMSDLNNQKGVLCNLDELVLLRPHCYKDCFRTPELDMKNC